jgi:eukaryotic-like serine/threonine-protein kinase
MSGHVPGAIVPGAIIGGKYKIERQIARGGQGTVFEATHIRLRQLVAIKFPHVDDQPGGQRAERLFREARAAFRLRSAHVARVIDVDMIDGAPFIVMEYLRGIDLKMLIESRGPLPCHEAVGLVIQACEGVAEAHDLGIVHRDLKPSNLFLEDRADGAPVVKVLDFGLSKSVAPSMASGEEADLTEPLVMLGSPRYMSPEQARDPRRADERSDIWSLGLILHELLTGRPAFRARTKADVLALVLLKNPTPVSLLRPDLPPGIERVVLRCLQKAPEHRFTSVRNLMTELGPFAQPAVARTAEMNAGPPPVLRRRHPVKIGAALLAGALLVGWGIHRRRQPAVRAPLASGQVAPSLPRSIAAEASAHVPPPALLACRLGDPRPAVAAVPTVRPAPPSPMAAPAAASAARARGHRRLRGEHQQSAASRQPKGRAVDPPRKDSPEIDDPLDGRK